MTESFQGTATLDAPFPGLRSFEAEESLLFYGREAHVAELLDRLGDNRFVAVTGTSGSGKSSLVRAGLRPALHRGYLLDATSRWRFATMRPGRAPIEALAACLADTFHDQKPDAISKALVTSSAGLAEVVARSSLERGESLLIIADQFEELFRFDVTSDQQSNAALFVNLLLESTEQRLAPIYVVVTMRSEFLGRCSEFTGLAEAFNRSQYLVPRLSRDERRDAIERPLQLVGVEPAPALVQQVLNDAGDDPDQLPVLQHVLLRTFREWKRSGATGRLERTHYAAVGGIEQALDRHGEEILSGMTASSRQVAEKLLRSLTTAQGGVALRRPRRLKELYGIVGAADDTAKQQVQTIVSTLANRDNSFVMLSPPGSLGPETIVDITHESLIRKWKTLQIWVREETRSVEWYADLARDVRRYRNQEVGLWEDPELSGLQKRRLDEGWNESWANQYRRVDDPTYDEVLSFLHESGQRQSARRQEEEERRDRELKQAQALASAKRRQSMILGLLLVGVAVIALILFRLVVVQRQLAVAATNEQEAAKKYASDLNSATRNFESRVNQLNGLLEQQAAALRSANTSQATSEDRARVEQLTKEIAAAQQRAQQSQDELAKLRNVQPSAGTDRNQTAQIDSLQKQLAQATSDRDRLQTQVTTLQRANGQATDSRIQDLQRQLDEERNRSAEANTTVSQLRAELATRRTASPPVASAQEVTKAFSDGVRAYDLGEWQSAVQSLNNAIRLQAGLKESIKEVRMSGTRFVPYAPQSYLTAALFELKSDCAVVQAALKQAQGEPPAPDVKSRLQAARTRCGGQ
jgi:hypothetical protein